MNGRDRIATPAAGQFPVGIARIHDLKLRGQMLKCPACAVSISSELERCPHCGITFHQAIAGATPANDRKSSLPVTSLILFGGGGLVALLVCGGIFSALTILPAVQQAREAERRDQAVKNLKQIGLALQNYHDQ